MDNEVVKTAEDEEFDEFYEAKLEEARRLEEEKYRFYEPSGKGEEFINAFASGENFIVLYSAANGVGKCKSLNAPILMADGSWKKLGDIKRGDWVLGHNYTGTGVATPSRVLGVSRAGIKKLYKFTFRDGGYTIASDEHSYPVKVRSGRNSKVEKKTIKELREYKQNYVGGSIKFQSPKYIEFKQDKELPIDPYVLGLLIGDGTLRTNAVSFTNINQEVLAKLRDILGDKYNYNQESDGITYRITANYDNDLLRSLQKLKLAGKKSGDKFIPDIYKTSSVEDRKKLLAGLIDTDGSYKEYTTKSKQLADDFCFIVKSLGGRANLKERVINNKFTHDEDSLFYRIYWKFDYKLPLVCDYKQKISKRPIEYSNRIVDKIEYVGEEETGDIWIEHDDHCYISDDFISTGNTCTCSNLLAHLFWPTEENKYFQGKMFKNWPHLKRGRIVSSPTNIDKNVIKELKDWFPKGRYTAKKGNKKFDSVWTTDTGWEFDIMTYEQDAMEFEGVTLGWAWFDEPPPEAIFKATVSRMRKGGIIFIGATPLAGSAYMYDSFAKGNFTVDIKGQDGALMRFERKVAYIEADIWSASRSKGIRGHLKDEDINNIIAEYSEDEKQARIYGKFQHLVGMVFKQWNRKVHVIPPFEITFKDFTVYEFLDPHPRNPDAVMWVAVDRKGTKYVIDEMFIKVESTEELAMKIKNKASQYRVVKRMADPWIFVKNQHNQHGKTIGMELNDLGLNYIEATKQRAMSDRRIRDALNYVEINGHMMKAPEVYVFDTCERTIYEMEHYRWQENTGKGADNKNASEKTVDKDDHMVENLGRALYNEPCFVPYERPAPYTAPNLDPYN